MTHSNLHITAEDPHSAICMQLISEQSAEVAAAYGDPPDATADVPYGITAAGGVFLVAWLGADAVGCGGLRRLGTDALGEVKRMYVRPTARRQGVARALLTALEAYGQQFGYRALRLETGSRQTEAVALYAAAGYQRITCYGKYASDPISICFEKRLADDSAD